MLALSPVTEAAGQGKKALRKPAFGDLRPTWTDDYQVSSGGNSLWANPNLSYLGRKTQSPYQFMDPLTEQLSNLMAPDQAAAWRAQYESMDRVYEQKRAAGLSNINTDKSHAAAVMGMTDMMVNEVQKRKLQDTGTTAVDVVKRSNPPKAIVYPTIVVAGLWIGRPVRVRIFDLGHFYFRTSVKDRYGRVELQSKIFDGSFEVHPLAAESYDLVGPTSPNIGRSMDFGNIIDFGQERYQVRFARTVPFVNLAGAVLYGSSSNVVASSLSKQLSPHWSAVVDSVYHLTPYDPTRSREERVRLRYDIQF